MSNITAEIEKAVNRQDNLTIKEILDNISMRKYNAYIQWLMIGAMCYGNINLGEYKNFQRSVPHDSNHK